MIMGQAAGGRAKRRLGTPMDGSPEGYRREAYGRDARRLSTGSLWTGRPEAIDGEAYGRLWTGRLEAYRREAYGRLWTGRLWTGRLWMHPMNAADALGREALV